MTISKIFLILGIGFMVATLITVFAGILLMAAGNDANRKYGTKLMAARVYLQALAIGSILAAFGTAGD